MTTYLVRASPVEERLPELRERLDSGEIGEIEPFGSEVEDALNDARFDPGSEEAVWVETCYCSRPLKAERGELLDEYFQDFEFEELHGKPSVEDVIGGLPKLWDEL